MKKNERKHFDEVKSPERIEYFISARDMSLSIVFHYKNKSEIIKFGYLNSLSLTQYLYNNLSDYCKKEGFVLKEDK